MKIEYALLIALIGMGLAVALGRLGASTHDYIDFASGEINRTVKEQIK